MGTSCSNQESISISTNKDHRRRQSLEHNLNQHNLLISNKEHNNNSIKEYSVSNQQYYDKQYSLNTKSKKNPLKQFKKLKHNILNYLLEFLDEECLCQCKYLNKRFNNIIPFKAKKLIIENSNIVHTTKFLCLSIPDNIYKPLSLKIIIESKDEGLCYYPNLSLSAYVKFQLYDKGGNSESNKVDNESNNESNKVDKDNINHNNTQDKVDNGSINYTKIINHNYLGINDIEINNSIKRTETYFKFSKENTPENEKIANNFIPNGQILIEGSKNTGFICFITYAYLELKYISKEK